MRVLIAPDCFTGSLDAVQAAASIADGWARTAPDDVLEQCPLSDGGPGFLEVLIQTMDGARLEQVTAQGPLGEPQQVPVLLSGTSAYLESAHTCGLHLVPQDARNPTLTSTFGLGQAMVAAVQHGARRLVIGLGGSGTNDGGAGMLAALAQAAGLDVDERLRCGGGALRGLTARDLSWLPQVCAHWAAVELVIASDVDSPLLGFHGASATFAAQKGATPQQAQELERCLGDLAAAAMTALGTPERISGAGAASSVAGSGAAGGLGFALQILGAQTISGASVVLDALDFTARLQRNDLVLTGEGCFDWQSLRGKVVSAVAAASRDVGLPVVVLAGQAMVGRREAQTIGVDATYAMAKTPGEVEAAMREAAPSLATLSQRVARTWSHN